MASESQENAEGFKIWGKCLGEKIGNMVTGAALDFKKLGQEDPRRIVHSVKVGLAISFVSSIYYFDFLYEGFGVSAMWAVMTVVVVFEFSVGATLGKGLNRVIATLLGGALALGTHKLASFAGEKAECAILGLSVYIIGSLATYTRFYPAFKARYDYGILIFILTFSLISVSGYRDDEVLAMAYKRLSTVIIGGLATLVVCIFIAPVWAGEDLHNIMASNIEKLAMFLEDFGSEYFMLLSDGEDRMKEVSLDVYKSVLNGKGTEDSLVNFAKWEPRHGKFRYRHPWDQYLKIGSFTRDCAIRIDLLNAYLNSDVQTPAEARTKIQESCTKMSSECSYALRELALGIQTMTCSSSADNHLVNAKAAAKKIKSTLKTSLSPDIDVFDTIPVLSVASLLIEVVSCTVKIADSVHELASLSKFRIRDDTSKSSVEKLSRTPSIEESHNFGILVE